MFQNGALEQLSAVQGEEDPVQVQAQIQDAIAHIEALIAKLPPQFLGPDGSLRSPADLPHDAGQALLKLRGEIGELRRRIDQLADVAA